MQDKLQLCVLEMMTHLAKNSAVRETTCTFSTSGQAFFNSLTQLCYLQIVQNMEALQRSSDLSIIEVSSTKGKTTSLVDTLPSTGKHNLKATKDSGQLQVDVALSCRAQQLHWSISMIQSSLTSSRLATGRSLAINACPLWVQTVL